MVESCLSSWGLTRVLSLTVDNATSNDKAIEYQQNGLMSWNRLVLNGNYLHMCCCAYIINLIVQEGFCQTLILFGDYHSLIFWFLLVELRGSTLVIAWSKGSLSVLIKNAKGYLRRGQKGLFMDFPRSQLAQASIWLAWAMKWLHGQATSSLGRASTTPNWLFAYK